MGNLLKIKRLSKKFYLLTSLLLVVIPCYYVVYWVFINSLPSTLVTVNVAETSLIPHPLPVKLQLLGYAASLLPLAALLYGLTNLRRLFALYREGIFFSFEQVTIFKKISKALFSWVLFSMFYESVKSILFSMGNPPGQRVVSVAFGSSEITNLMIGGIIFVVAWIMEEGRILAEEQQLIV